MPPPSGPKGVVEYPTPPRTSESISIPAISETHELSYEETGGQGRIEEEDNTGGQGRIEEEDNTGGQGRIEEEDNASSAIVTPRVEGDPNALAAIKIQGLMRRRLAVKTSDARRVLSSQRERHLEELLPLYEQLYELPEGSQDLGEVARDKMLERLIIRDVCGKGEDSLTKVGMRALQQRRLGMEKKVASRAEKRGDMLEDIEGSCELLGINIEEDILKSAALPEPGETGWISDRVLGTLLDQMKDMRQMCLEAGLDDPDDMLAEAEMMVEEGLEGGGRGIDEEIDAELSRPNSRLKSRGHMGSYELDLAQVATSLGLIPKPNSPTTPLP